MSSKTQIAQILAGSPAAFDSQGLQQPPEVTQAILAMLMPGLGSAVKDAAVTAPQRLASEAGAIFPEGAALPTERGALREMAEVLTPSQQAYRQNEALSNWHASNMDWPRVLQDKWALLKNFGGS